MIYFINGVVAEKTNGGIVIEANGLGYFLSVSAQTMTHCTVGETVKLHTYMQVREDAVALYGFSRPQERDMFLHLISVSGIGCRIAVSILSNITPYDLAIAIAGADTKALSSVKGIGKKSAERIVLELKEKIAAVDPAAKSAAIPSMQINDAILALQALGFSHAEATQQVLKIENAASKSLDELVRAALRGMGS